MLTRYLHIPHELTDDIAAQVGGLMWAAPAAADVDDEEDELTDEQRTALLKLVAALPDRWRQQRPPTTSA